MRRFAGVELGKDVVPDETTILRFRYLLEKHGLTEVMAWDVRQRRLSWFQLEPRKVFERRIGSVACLTLAPASGD